MVLYVPAETIFVNVIFSTSGQSHRWQLVVRIVVVLLLNSILLWWLVSHSIIWMPYTCKDTRVRFSQSGFYPGFHIWGWRQEDEDSSLSTLLFLPLFSFILLRSFPTVPQFSYRVRERCKLLWWVWVHFGTFSGKKDTFYSVFFYELLFKKDWRWSIILSEN